MLKPTPPAPDLSGETFEQARARVRKNLQAKVVARGQQEEAEQQLQKRQAEAREMAQRQAQESKERAAREARQAAIEANSRQWLEMEQQEAEKRKRSKQGQGTLAMRPKRPAPK